MFIEEVLTELILFRCQNQKLDSVFFLVLFGIFSSFVYVYIFDVGVGVGASYFWCFSLVREFNQFG